MSTPIVVVMGVSGCGKSTIGQQLATAMGVEFLEGDQFARMAAGIALTDDDRQGWLETLAGHIGSARANAVGLVVSCSALKRSYRDILRLGSPDLLFVHLQGSPELLTARMASRPGHYMPASLLESQLATLEIPGPDENAQTFDITISAAAIVAAVMASVPI